MILKTFHSSAASAHLHDEYVWHWNPSTTRRDIVTSWRMHYPDSFKSRYKSAVMNINQRQRFIFDEGTQLNIVGPLNARLASTCRIQSCDQSWPATVARWILHK